MVPSFGRGESTELPLESPLRYVTVHWNPATPNYTTVGLNKLFIRGTALTDASTHQNFLKEISQRTFNAPVGLRHSSLQVPVKIAVQISHCLFTGWR